MNKAIILHGTSSSSQGNWIPWLKKQLEDRNWQVWTPDLPDADQPNLTKYLNYFFTNVPFEIDKDTTLIGHSSGSVAVLGLLQNLPSNTQVDRAILVSAFHTDLGWNKLSELFEQPLNFPTISQHVHSITLVHSDNDPYVQLSEPEFVAKQLNCELRVIKGQGHFNLEASPTYKEFPKLLAMIVKEPLPGKIFLTSSFRHVHQRILPMLPADRSNCTVVFVETAANVYDHGNRPWFDEERQLLDQLGFPVIDLDIADKSEAEVCSVLDKAAIIFVEGGNTIYLLEQAQKCNFGKLVAENIKHGVHYIGSSAGSVITSPDISPEVYFEVKHHTPKLKSYAGFGLVPFLVCPHWGSQHFENDYLQSLPSTYREYKYPIITLADDQFVVVEDGKFEMFTQATE